MRWTRQSSNFPVLLLDKHFREGVVCLLITHWYIEVVAETKEATKSKQTARKGQREQPEFANIRLVKVTTQPLHWIVFLDDAT